MISTIPLSKQDFPEVKQINALMHKLCRRVRKKDKHVVCVEALFNANGSCSVVKRIARTEVPDSAITHKGEPQ